MITAGLFDCGLRQAHQVVLISCCTVHGRLAGRRIRRSMCRAFLDSLVRDKSEPIAVFSYRAYKIFEFE